MGWDAWHVSHHGSASSYSTLRSDKVVMPWADPQRPEPAPGRAGSGPGDRDAAVAGDAAVASGQHGRGLACHVGYCHQRDVRRPRPARESRLILLARRSRSIPDSYL